ncbi:pre-rRNA processing protein [Bulinus truncatus]|nr:pre-rRNA processing protein [Bulinus truncatus]
MDSNFLLYLSILFNSNQTLLQSCIDVEKATNSNTLKTCAQKLIKTLETSLSYQFCSVWSLVFQLWSAAFLVLGKIAPRSLLMCLTSMGELRDTPHFSFKGEMDYAIGNAVKAMGPSLVLEAIPLGITGENDNLEFPRGWLLPLLRDNVTHTELHFFASYFLPLAAKFKIKADQLSKERRIAESKIYDTLHFQIWSLLKGFCDHPTDITKSFQAVAKTLGTALSEREDLQMDIMAALRSLISCCIENEADKKEIGRFAKNYLPILFNLFTDENTSNDGIRLAALETIKKYLLVTDEKLILTFLDKCLDKMNLDAKGFRNIALLDLVMAMVPYADGKNLKKIFDMCLLELSSEEKTIQKKSYRILEEIIKSDTVYCKELLLSNLKQISETLLMSLSKSSPSSKAPRLRCLILVYKNLMQKNMEFFQSTLPEAILCTKEIGSKARTVAFELLIIMAETYIRWHPDWSENENLRVFVRNVMAGLAGSVHMISATVIALTHIVFKFKGKLTGLVIDNLIDNACLLLASKTREVTKAALGFVKVLLSAYENTVLASHLKDLLNSLHDVALKGNMKRLIKIIYAKFIKKFGYELILSMTQPSVHKLLKNIHKTNERLKKKKDGKENSDNESDSDGDSDGEKFTTQPESIDDLLQDSDTDIDDDEVHKKKIKRKHGNDAWLMESGDDIVDFMDPAAAKSVLATRPQEVVKDKKSVDGKRGFKLSSDGRLIITQEDEEEQINKNKTKKNVKDDYDNENSDSDLDDAQKVSRKRKHASNPVYDDDDEFVPPPSKYQAGGSGIHRPVTKSDKEKLDVGKEYRSKKALGDVKKKGKPDPYAYVPLNFNSLNKRKQMKVKGTFSNLVKGARRGAAKGNKSRISKRSKK